MLGVWTFEFRDYIDLNFTADLDNPAVQLMADINDPIGKSMCRDCFLFGKTFHFRTYTITIGHLAVGRLLLRIIMN